MRVFSLCVFTTGRVIRYGRWKFQIVGIEIFALFGSCDLYLDPMTFIYELDPYCLELYRMCKYELPTSKLSNVIV